MDESGKSGGRAESQPLNMIQMAPCGLFPGKLAESAVTLAAKGMIPRRPGKGIDGCEGHRSESVS